MHRFAMQRAAHPNQQDKNKEGLSWSSPTA